MIMAGNHNWWSMSGMHPQSHQLSSSFSYGSSSSLSSLTSNSPAEQTIQETPVQSWKDLFSMNSSADPSSRDCPVPSWSQLLLGGLTGGGGEEEKFGANLFQQQKKLETWEDQILNPTFRVPVVDVKQEVSQSSQFYGHVDDEFQASRSSPWTHQVMPVSSPSSCVTSLRNNVFNLSGSKANSGVKNPHPNHSSECNNMGTGGVSKKARVQQSSTQPALKVRKEKLGDRITALHQLVSPFGKTDTASVLSEAIGYIRFLQGQIEALSSPYMGNTSESMDHQQSVQERNCLFRAEPGQESEGRLKDLRSRGLCLVPLSCTQHVENEGGADFWAPALGGGF